MMPTCDQKASATQKSGAAQTWAQRLTWLTAVGTVLLITSATGAATFSVANKDIAGLKEAIHVSNTNNAADTINLAPRGTYTLAAVDNTTFGANGLPAIAADGGHSLTIIGNGATITRSTADSTPEFRILLLSPASSVSIFSLTISNGKSDGGGGIANDHGTLTMNRCTLSHNSAVFAGAIDNWNENGTATAKLSNCTLSHNTAEASGGAIYNTGWNGNGTLILSNCTFSHNSAGAGGAIINGGGYNGTALLNVSHCTFSQNSAPPGKGRSIYNDGSNGGDALLKLSNTMLNDGDDSLSNGPRGIITSLGHNLSRDDGGGFLSGDGDKIDTNPKLGPLAHNGGLTRTHALLPGSPAINRGHSSVATDQRGYARLGAPDIGAFEFNGTPPLAWRVDALIKKNSDVNTAYAVNNIYQLTPTGAQVEKQTVNPGSPAVYQVKVQNDTNVSRAFGVKVTESVGVGWTIVYRKDAINISPAMRGAAGYKTSILDPGASEVVTVEMTAAAGSGASKSATIRVFLGGIDKVTRDAVRATTTIAASTTDS